MVTTETERDPDPETGTPDPTLVNDAAAMTAPQTGQQYEYHRHRSTAVNLYF